MRLRPVAFGGVAAFVAGFVCACSSSNPAGPPPSESDLDGGSKDGPGSMLGTGDANMLPGPDASGGDASRGADGSLGSGGDGSAPAADAMGEGGEDAPNLGPLPTPVCPPGATWGQGTQLAISTAADDLMGAITPDELSIAWISTTGTNVEVLYADESSAQGPFATAAMAPAASGFYAPTKVALSPDGLRLLVVASNHKSFGVTTRSARPGSFTLAPGGGEVDAINSNIAEGEASFFVDDPVIGAGDTTFYYSFYGSGLVDTLLETTRTGSTPWPDGVSLSGTAGAFASSGSELRRPTGVSADDLTVFYWDDVDATEKVAWRPRTSESFGAPVTLGALKGAAPNAACDKLYYSAPGTAGGMDLFVAARQ